MIFQLLRLPDGRAHFPYVSEAVRALYNSTPMAALDSAEAVFGRVLAEDRPALNLALATAATDTALRSRVRAQRRGGSITWHEFSATLRRLVSDVVLWHGHVADVTQRQRLAVVHTAGQGLLGLAISQQ